MYIGEDFQTPSDDETRLVAYFEDANACDIPALHVIQESADMLSKSPLINILEVALRPRDPEKDEAVNLRAYELFLENGVLEPPKVANVKRFTINFALANRLPQGKLFQPKQKHLDIIDDLKITIECNWMIKPACPWRKKEKARSSVGALGRHASGRQIGMEDDKFTTGV